MIALFRQTFNENQLLHRRVAELERELSVWKLALKTADEDSAALKGTNANLEQVLSSLKVGFIPFAWLNHLTTRLRTITHSFFV
jgi:hypothetical protein